MFEGRVEDFVMTDEEKRVFDSVMELHDKIARIVDTVENNIPSSRERSLVITKLQEADMWLGMVSLS